ncbi:MAG: hypothetical protein ABW170_23365 [Candidatus Thiodiazotropha sp. L084R]
MPYIAPYRSQLRPYNHAYAYRGLTAFATLSMAVSECKSVIVKLIRSEENFYRSMRHSAIHQYPKIQSEK